jgi:two-component system OmpR family sensor kinase
MFSAIRNTLTPKSIKAQLTLWYLLMLGAALAAFAMFVFSVRAQTLYREADANLELRAQRLLRDLQPLLLELDVAGALADNRRLADEPALVREHTGAVVFRSPAFPALSGPAEADVSRAARTAEHLVDAEDRFGDPIRVATVVTERPGASPLVVQLAGSSDATRRALRQLALTLALFFAVVLAVASYGGSFIAQRALRPVESINARVRAIQASSLGERLEVRTGSDELDGLVDTLNGMLDRIETSMRGARRFAADASHELQTPIAALRTAVDVCVCGSRTAADCRAVAADLAIDLDRMSTLVRDLRLLALADAGHLVDRVEPVDLTALVHECCDIVRALAEPTGIVVSVDVLSDIVVNGSALHLRRALLNLTQNAVRYSPDGSMVQITVTRLDDEAVLAIADEGCGIHADDLPHIFERFYRADPARARDTGGSGLGLAIADQIVRSHGGRIEVTSAVGNGSTFLVFLPCATASDCPPRLDTPATMNSV